MSLFNLKLLERSHFECVDKEVKSIALVGSGPVEENDGLQEILNSDVVVRFNNWATRRECIPYLPNSSGRCDVLVSTFDLHSRCLGTGDIDRPKVAVIAIPSPFHQSRIMNFLDVWYPYCQHAMVNPYLCRLMCEDLELDSEGWKHPMPTVGFTAIWNLYHIKRLTNWDVKVFICGFDWKYDSNLDKINGMSLGESRCPTHWNHSYPMEALWVCRNLWNDDDWDFSKRASGTMERLHGSEFQWGGKLALPKSNSSIPNS